MSVLVKGMEKPEHCGYCRFRYDGICHALQRTQYSMDECPLIDEDVIKAQSSAQPEILACGEGELNVPDKNVGDMINRQAAVCTIEEYADRLQMVDWNKNPGVMYKAHALNWCINTIRDLPSAERKKGEWIDMNTLTTMYMPRYKCSICDEWANKSNYCPNCGADMRGEQDG